MARRATDRLGLARSVETDTFLVERNPNYADWTIWTRGKHVEIAAAPSVLEHLFVVAEPGYLYDSLHFPFANRRSRAPRTDGNRISGDQFVRFEDSKHIRFRIDLDRHRSCGGR